MVIFHGSVVQITVPFTTTLLSLISTSPGVVSITFSGVHSLLSPDAPIAEFF
jgi:hypothetical protein